MLAKYAGTGIVIEAGPRFCDLAPGPRYSAIRLMDHLIMVQFCYWFKFRLVPNGMINLLCKDIWLKVQNNLHKGSKLLHMKVHVSVICLILHN